MDIYEYYILNRGLNIMNLVINDMYIHNTKCQ